MKIKLIIIGYLISLVVAMPTFATTWFAQGGSANIDAVTWKDACSSGNTLTWASRAAGDVFVANGNTAIAINVDPGVSDTPVTLTTAGNGCTDGGGFTYATASNLTAYFHCVAGTTACIVISGSSGGFSWHGDRTGGSVSSAFGASSSHSTITTTFTGNSIGGGAAGAAGYYTSGSSGGTTHAGDCIASSSVNAVGCNATNAAITTVTGNIVDSAYAAGKTGKVYFKPAAATNYYRAYNGTGTTDYYGADTDPGEANVKTGTSYVYHGGAKNGSYSASGSVPSIY